MENTVKCACGDTTCLLDCNVQEMLIDVMNELSEGKNQSFCTDDEEDRKKLAENLANALGDWYVPKYRIGRKGL